ncbi:hypothetical protein [Janthinobacterium psychrotolerans]|uniref:Surface antigen n=1 Tax=Janthinobacterium psychrotolerans TaxID=1747903 RepID=A0A1A7C545_9BURK|nr:hypothetical protein [Janthinobacterium psychrotolerans]OBV39875.1 hypothetical protein ASR47_101297 [Janthinobacterium psychrotolerans]
MPSLFSRHAICLSFAAFGLAFSASAAAQTFLDELTVVNLSPRDKEALMWELFNDLNKDDDDQEAHVWESDDEAATMQAVYSFSNSGMTEQSLKAHVCRDLKFVVTAGGKTQDLSRRTCSQNSGRWDIQGKDAPPVTYPPFLSDVTVAKLNAKEKKDLLNAAVRTLKDEEDGKTRQWRNQGMGNTVPLRVSLTPSDTGTRPGSFTTCRDLTMVFDGRNGKQELRRRSCENRYGALDIEPDYKEDR